MTTGGLLKYIGMVWGMMLWLSGCTSVDFAASGADENEQVQTVVEMEMDWEGAVSEGFKEDRPDSMYVAMSRVVNSIHYVWTMGRLDHLEAEIEGGGYYAIAFNNDTSVYNVIGLDDFKNNPEVSMREVIAQTRLMENDDLKEKYGEGFTDFNPSYPFIRNGIALYQAGASLQIVEGTREPLIFKPRLLTQRLTFSITVETDEEVVIDRILAEVSGVVKDVELMVGRVDDSTTYRVLFPMEEVKREGSRLEYEGKVNVLGLFPSYDLQYVTGPGILQLSIWTKSGVHEKVFHAGINLRDVIGRAKLMEELPAENGGGYRVARHDAAMKVEAILKIKKDQVEDDLGEGVVGWFDSDDRIDIEV